MKNMTSTFKSNPLPMHRDFVRKQLMGTIINKHRKVKQAQLQKFKHIERKLDIIVIPTKLGSPKKFLCTNPNQEESYQKKVSVN